MLSVSLKRRAEFTPKMHQIEPFEPEIFKIFQGSMPFPPPPTPIPTRYGAFLVSKFKHAIQTFNLAIQTFNSTIQTFNSAIQIFKFVNSNIHFASQVTGPLFLLIQKNTKTFISHLAFYSKPFWLDWAYGDVLTSLSSSRFCSNHERLPFARKIRLEWNARNGTGFSWCGVSPGASLSQLEEINNKSKWLPRLQCRKAGKEAQVNRVGNSPNFEEKTPISTNFRKDKLRYSNKPNLIFEKKNYDVP